MTTGADASSPRAALRRVDWASRLRGVGILLPFTILFVVLSLTSSSFFTKANMLNILDQ
jgi:predicted ABC-type sugar transport system permease subunit